MIDPQVSLAFALHSNRGAHAVLVGSGVSVGAGIPTGWQVVLDLISKVARVASRYTESLPLFHELNDLTGIGGALAGLGTVAWLQGDHEEAHRLHKEALNNFRDSREGSSIAFCLTCLAGGVYPPDGLQGLVKRHNERLDLAPEEWSKEVIAEVVHRSGTAV